MSNLVYTLTRQAFKSGFPANVLLPVGVKPRLRFLLDFPQFLPSGGSEGRFSSDSSYRPSASQRPENPAREPPSWRRPAGGARPPPAGPGRVAGAAPRKASSERCRFSWTVLLLWVVVQTLQTVPGFQGPRRCSRAPPRPHGFLWKAGEPLHRTCRPGLILSPVRANHERLGATGSRRPRPHPVVSGGQDGVGAGAGGGAATRPRASRPRPERSGSSRGALGGPATGGRTSGGRSEGRPAPARPAPPRCGGQSRRPRRYDYQQQRRPRSKHVLTCGADAGRGAGGIGGCPARVPGAAPPPPPPGRKRGRARPPQRTREPGEVGPRARGRPSAPGPALSVTDSRSGPETPPPPAQTRWRHPNTCWAGPEKVAPGVRQHPRSRVSLDGAFHTLEVSAALKPQRHRQALHSRGKVTVHCDPRNVIG
ncbi:collagen alpha-1(I) chain-like [Felis catus]|uniref:collagen alpha-1(I) chain-like n=1 Tax=Felis catus TaxID=9685 RepID=UPI001D1A1777|nr:collagen alpha-1(I) chain-like [Felis catus]